MSLIKTTSGVTGIALVALCCFPCLGADNSPATAAARDALLKAAAPRLTPDTQVEISRLGSSTVLSLNAEDEPYRLLCSLCSTGEVVAAARQLGAQISNDRGGPSPMIITLQGVPPDGVARIDGLPALTGAPQRLEPGNHSLEVTVDDEVYRTQTSGEPGDDTLVLFREMERVPPPHRALRLGVGLAGLGAALTSAGSVFLSFEGECGTSTVDASGDCESLHHTAPLGWALLGTGAAAVITGTTVAILAAVRHRRNHSRTVKGGGR